ncbi:hypothetical protein [Caldimonas sp. KR1-144]|uniref:hypothetical protein n=1 Tax=Caldimonas sp. KR1-144 TaxID=3400911 RepID=UPI003C0B2A0F
MIKHLRAEVALKAAMTASLQYADLATDRDPDDGEHVVPGELRRFLARLRLLHGVPFSYLVPDEQLLPVESIRFFHLDRAWTDALVQGALSVGTVSSADRTQLESVYPHVRDEVDAAERVIRRPEKEDRLDGAGGAITGFLLRSRAVSGWPNLHVRAYREDVLPDSALSTVAESHPSRLKVLRMERLAPAVLLVLIDGVPAVVHIEEPRQGLQFGARLDNADATGHRAARVHARDALSGKKVLPEEVMNDTNSVPVPFRPGAPGVLNVTALRDRLVPKVPNADGALAPNAFALQMLRFPYRQVFGDPDAPREQDRFYSLDAFKVTLALEQWKTALKARLEP